MTGTLRGPHPELQWNTALGAMKFFPQPLALAQREVGGL